MLQIYALFCRKQKERGRNAPKKAENKLCKLHLNRFNMPSNLCSRLLINSSFVYSQFGVSKRAKTLH